MANFLSRSLNHWDACMHDLDELEHTDKDAAVKAIDARIEQLQATTPELTRSLRSHRNAMAPISLLPPEILCLIFHYLLHTDLSGLNPIPEYTWPPLAGVTAVCRAWRTTALSFPPLWSIIDFSSQAVATEMLERSANSLLSISLHSCEAWEKLWSISCSHPFNLPDPMRLKELHLSGMGSENAESALRHILIARKADRLQTLRILHCNRLSIPKELFTMSMQCLRHLEIIGCDLPWSAILTCDLLTNLMSFCLYCSKPPLRQQLYKLLSKMPNLQSLYLGDCFTTASGRSNFTWNAPVIRFSKLTSLGLACTFSRFQQFHKLVSYPVGGIIEFQICHRYRDPPDEETLAIDYLIRHFRVGDELTRSGDGLPSLHYTNLLISMEHQAPSGELTTWNGTGNSIYNNLASPSHPLVKISLYQRAYGWDVFPHILKLRIAGLKWLSINITYYPDMDENNRVYGRPTQDESDYFEDSDDDDFSPAFTEEQWRTFFYFHEEITHLRFFNFISDAALAALYSSSPRQVLPNLKAICISVDSSHDEVRYKRFSDYHPYQQDILNKLSAFSATPRGQSLQFILIPPNFTEDEDLPRLQDINWPRPRRDRAVERPIIS